MTTKRTCQSCIEPATHVITDNVTEGYTPGVRDYVLDDSGYSQVGVVCCDRCADNAREVGYTVETLA